MYDGSCFYQLGILDARIGINLGHAVRQGSDGVSVVSPVGAVEWRQDVFLEERLSIYVRGHVVQHRCHRVSAMRNGAEVELTADVGSAFLIHRDTVVKFGDKLSSGSMRNGIHCRHEHEGGVALVGAHLELGIGIACSVASARGINLLGIAEYAAHHRVGESVALIAFLSACRKWQAASCDSQGYDVK